DVLESHGSTRVRPTPHQKLVVLDIDEPRVESVLTALGDLDLAVRPSPFRQHSMACTGIEFCKLAIVETKGLAADTVSELEKRLADVENQIDVPITLNVTAAPTRARVSRSPTSDSRDRS